LAEILHSHETALQVVALPRATTPSRPAISRSESSGVSARARDTASLYSLGGQRKAIRLENTYAQTNHPTIHCAPTARTDCWRSASFHAKCHVISAFAEQSTDVEGTDCGASLCENQNQTAGPRLHW